MISLFLLEMTPLGGFFHLMRIVSILNQQKPTNMHVVKSQKVPTVKHNIF